VPVYARLLFTVLVSAIQVSPVYFYNLISCLYVLYFSYPKM